LKAWVRTIYMVRVGWIDWISLTKCIKRMV